MFVWERASCFELGYQDLPALAPGVPYQTVIPLQGHELDALAVALVDADNHVLAAYGPTTCLDQTPSKPHLGYGINVRDLANLDTLVAPLGVGWIRLWDEYSGIPATALPYNVLYNINCGAYINNMGAWGSAIDAIALAGKGKVNAYELCNEPNVIGFWSNNPPDPARFSEMLCIANARIKAIDPAASVISGGLAPVGRIRASITGGQGTTVTQWTSALTCRRCWTVAQEHV